MIFSDNEKKRVWNDPVKLQDMIKLVAHQKYVSGRLYNDLMEKLEEATNAVNLLESKLRITRSEVDEAESLGLELTNRLMELETGE
jgi:hypothetical protein